MTFPVHGSRAPPSRPDACAASPHALSPTASSRLQPGHPGGRRAEQPHCPVAGIVLEPSCAIDFAPARPTAEVGVQTVRNDAHAHIGPGYSPAQVRDFSNPLAYSLRRQLKMMDAAGVGKAWCMPIPTNIVGGRFACGHGDPRRLGRTYYMPDSLRFNRERMTSETMDRLGDISQYYNSSVDWEVAHAWWSLDPDERERLHPCLTGVNLADPQAVLAVMRLKNVYRGTFCWMGEITRDKEIVSFQNRCYRPGDDEDAGLHAELAFAGRSGMGFTLHEDISDARECIRTGEPGRSENLPVLWQLLSRHTETVVVLAHMGLGKYSPPSDRHADDLRRLLDAFPRFNLDISWGAVADHYVCNPQPAANLTEHQRGLFDARSDARERKRRIRELASLIRAYPDRFLFGSDTLNPWNPDDYCTAYAKYSNYGQGQGTATRGGGYGCLFDYLPDDTLQKVLNGNSDRLYRNASTASRDYEEAGMRDDMEDIERQAEDNGGTPNNWY